MDVDLHFRLSRPTAVRHDLLRNGTHCNEQGHEKDEEPGSGQDRAEDFSRVRASLTGRLSEKILRVPRDLGMLLEKGLKCRIWRQVVGLVRQ